MSALRLALALSLLAGCSEVEVNCPSLSKEGCWDETEACRWSGDFFGCLHVCAGQADCEVGYVCQLSGYEPEYDSPEDINSATELCLEESSFSQ